MLPHPCPIPLGGWGGRHVCLCPRSHGVRWSMAAVPVIRVSSEVWVLAYRRSRHRESQGSGVARMSDEDGAEGG